MLFDEILDLSNLNPIIYFLPLPKLVELGILKKPTEEIISLNDLNKK